jgi:hypothetical protein
VSEYAIALFDVEGFIILDDEGKLYTNQTGGVSCNHPTATGTFLFGSIPEEIQLLTLDKCYLDELEIMKINHAFNMAGIPFVATSGEEAWLHGEYENKSAIATWENSD